MATGVSAERSGQTAGIEDFAGVVLHSKNQDGLDWIGKQRSSWNGNSGHDVAQDLT